jgi:hypothetical protein
MYMCLHVKYPLFLSDFNETWNFSTNFRKILKYQFFLNSSSGSRVVSCGRSEPPTDRQTEMTKLKITFRNFGNAFKVEGGASPNAVLEMNKV